MDEAFDRQPLLTSNVEEDGICRKAVNFLSMFVSYGLMLFMWAIFLTFVAVMYLFPMNFSTEIYLKWIYETKGTVYGSSGSHFLLFTAPVLAIALLGTIHAALFPRKAEYYEIKKKKKKKRLPSFRLWTFPVIANGAFGVISAAELIGIVAFAAYILLALPCYVLRYLTEELENTAEGKICVLLDVVGRCLASVGVFFVGFLFLPVTRGSILLCLVRIPIEHAIRYHVWLGHITMILFTFHALLFLVSWSLQGILLSQIIQWESAAISIFPGVIAILAGLLMWTTSRSPVRRNHFELFLYTHQLYAVFIIFAAMHVGGTRFYEIAGAVLLFIMDRFLRFCQSRVTVDVLSARCYPCGAVELTLSKPKDMEYSPLGFVFLQVKELSWFQWHPFSVSSSPLDGKLHLTVLIKVAGKWTQMLRNQISNAKNPGDLKLSVAVEGPYGHDHESPYYLQYENLMLVAGGIGISPFLAILKDIFHRAEEKRPCFPKTILLVWSVKRSEELSLLSETGVTSMCSFFPKMLNLKVHIYVTQESESPAEVGNHGGGGDAATYTLESTGSCMSTLVGSGNALMLGIYMFASIVGFIAFEGVASWVLGEVGADAWWLLGLVCVVCMLAGVVLFGGPVILLWRRWDRSSSDRALEEHKSAAVALHGSLECGRETVMDIISSGSIIYGRRPDFRDIFSSVVNRTGNVEVGVLVCGPAGLQETVAAECRSQNIKSDWVHPTFHFHSHSFEF